MLVVTSHTQNTTTNQKGSPPVTTLPALDTCNPPDYIRQEVEHLDALERNWNHTQQGAYQLLCEGLSGEAVTTYINAMLEAENRQGAQE